MNSLSKSDIERQIKAYIGLKNVAIVHGEKKTAKEFDKLIDELKITLEKNKSFCYVCKTEPVVVEGRCCTCHYDCP